MPEFDNDAVEKVAYRLGEYLAWDKDTGEYPDIAINRLTYWRTEWPESGEHIDVSSGKLPNKKELRAMAQAALSAIHFAEMQAVVEAARYWSDAAADTNAGRAAENYALGLLRAAIYVLDARLKPTPPGSSS